MSAEVAVRVAIAVAAVIALAWPYIEPYIKMALDTRRTASPSDSADAHTVMSIAMRLKAAGKVKSAEIARSLIDTMLTE